ncbi:HNH endonuclease [Bosea sp. LjRoot237]|uniref:HNH endonuclease n=1 Tax=Bosea sp. LjRoot237 TaxID=3342292 RepID=UPI003ECDDD65
MLAAKQSLILREVEEGTGAAIGLEEDRSGMQIGLRLWFADLPRSHSPIVTLRPAGLRRFRATLTFGNFAADTVRQMSRADAEEVQLARALVSSVAGDATVRFGGGQLLDDWRIHDGSFSLIAEKRDIAERFEDDALAATCRELVIPLLAAMAELYGYDPVEEPVVLAGEIEGSLSVSLIRRRERNPRNRLLALRIHGELCKVCGFDPARQYPNLRSIIEVHHIQPLSSLSEPRAYDPSEDLIPLCPNCHRAAHTRRPLPWSPAELRAMLYHD